MIWVPAGDFLSAVASSQGGPSCHRALLHIVVACLALDIGAVAMSVPWPLMVHLGTGVPKVPGFSSMVIRMVLLFLILNVLQ